MTFSIGVVRAAYYPAFGGARAGQRGPAERDELGHGFPAVNEMESKNAAILVLAALAAVVITASATYAMTGRPAGEIVGPNPGPTYGYGMGPSMMRDTLARSG